jgi:hypothetical protein
VPLAVAYPQLHSLSNQKSSLVMDLLAFEGEDRVWSFSWRRNLFQWEEDLVAHLKDLLGTAVLTLEDDRWCWLPDPERVFSVKSAYKLLSEDLLIGFEVEDGLRGVLDQIWKSSAPSKVIAFSWQLLVDRIPTRNNLEVCGILVSEVLWECVGCVGKVETPTNLFVALS